MLKYSICACIPRKFCTQIQWIYMYVCLYERLLFEKTHRRYSISASYLLNKMSFQIGSYLKTARKVSESKHRSRLQDLLKRADNLVAYTV